MKLLVGIVAAFGIFLERASGDGEITDAALIKHVENLVDILGKHPVEDEDIVLRWAELPGHGWEPVEVHTIIISKENASYVHDLHEPFNGERNRIMKAIKFQSAMPSYSGLVGEVLDYKNSVISSACVIFSMKPAGEKEWIHLRLPAGLVEQEGSKANALNQLFHEAGRTG